VVIDIANVFIPAIILDIDRYHSGFLFNKDLLKIQYTIVLGRDDLRKFLL